MRKPHEIPMGRESLYTRWKNMGQDRCTDWKSFDQFVSDMGVPAEDKVLFRLDTKAEFSPENCVWSSKADALQGENNPNYRQGIQTTECKHCGAEIKHLACRARTYCSRECRALATKKAKTCKECGAGFVDEFKVRGVFCSEECKDEHKARIEEVRVAKSPKKKYGVRHVAFCKMCGSKMMLRPSDVKKGKKFCSRSCYGKAVGLRQQGDAHHMWKGGVTASRDHVRNHSLYKEWRKAVFERDDFTCQSCFSKGGVLHAHHVVQYKDDPKKRLKKSNGMTLCGECHRQWHVFDSKGVFEGLEKNLQRKALDMFKAAGFFTFNVHGHRMQTAGIPDSILCFCGTFVGVEFKVFPNFLTPLQKVHAQKIKDAGGLYYMVRSEDDVHRIINEVRAGIMGSG